MTRPDFPPLASERTWARILHVGRQRIAQARKAGDLLAYQPGSRTFLIKRADILTWFETLRYRPDPQAAPHATVKVSPETRARVRRYERGEL